MLAFTERDWLQNYGLGGLGREYSCAYESHITIVSVIIILVIILHAHLRMHVVPFSSPPFKRHEMWVEHNEGIPWPIPLRCFTRFVSGEA